MIGMYSVIESKTRYKDVRDCNMSLHLHKYTYMYIYTYMHQNTEKFSSATGVSFRVKIFRDKFSIEDCKFESVCLTKLV